MITLPELKWNPTANSGSRHGHPVELVVVHRWGARYPGSEAATYEGVVNYFKEPSSQVSAHVVFPGSAVPGEATQMVHWEDMAWAEAAYNPVADEIESADAIWIGGDDHGLEVLARIVACRLHRRGLPPVWSHRRGFCRHADLGAAGGGHTSCPVDDGHLSRWEAFCHLVSIQYQRTPYRDPWGR